MHAKMFDERIASEIDIPADVISTIIPGLESNYFKFF
jgi:hypothetical protein